jgi:hypothetical protein
MKPESNLFFVGILVEMVNTLRIKGGAAPLDTVY